MSETSRIARIEAALRAGLEPEHLELLDESRDHAGHPGAADGRGHFRVWIASSRFRGCTRVERHRMVYAALDRELRSDIHALAIHAFDPDEWSRRERG